jgi:hypothetical protein
VGALYQRARQQSAARCNPWPCGSTLVPPTTTTPPGQIGQGGGRKIHLLRCNPASPPPPCSGTPLTPRTTWRTESRRPWWQRAAGAPAHTSPASQFPWRCTQKPQHPGGGNHPPPLLTRTPWPQPLPPPAYYQPIFAV